ncbi:ABC transporter ATP-binding protein [Dyella sp.]|uniref:ABC transporter ATP-binding protein n=1 Tax=Dyella sp. TaxID=1869338 RepID=UPI002ED5B946
MQQTGPEEAAGPGGGTDSPQDSQQARPPNLLDDIGRFGRAFSQLFGAQIGLLAAELGLARSAISWMLLAGLGATVAGVGLGLTLLGLVGVALAQWLGSWLWALAGLAVLQLLFLMGALWLFKRCMHWMSLPQSRGQMRAMVRDTVSRADIKAAAQAQESARARQGD